MRRGWGILDPVESGLALGGETVGGEVREDRNAENDHLKRKKLPNLHS